jgi:glycosyltransferase involved in cell wall biosynthesis
MKVAFIHPFLLRYARGIERYTVNLASALTRAGAQVDILTWRWSHPLVWGEQDSAVRILTVPTPRYYAAQFVWFFYGMHLLRERYDHVFVYFADYGEAQALNLLKRQSFSVVLHFPHSQVPHRYRTLMRSRLFARARHIIAVSPHVGVEMQSFSGRTCSVIPPGVDTSLFQPSSDARRMFRQELEIPPDTPLILSVCALEMRKGVQHVLRALPIVAQNVPEVQYLVVGDGPDAESLYKIARDLGVMHLTHFLPARSDVQICYQASDVFAILARGEALPSACLEAMSCELPVVASSQPPFDELIQPQWGCQINDEDPAKVADALTRLLLDGHSRARMGKAGREHILTHHNWDTIAARYLELLDGTPQI